MPSSLTVFGPAPASVAEPEYRPFPHDEGRDSRQAAVEVPIMVRGVG